MAKCGTSSLSKYLQQHPEIFISEKKEPRFITSQCMQFPLNGPKDHRVEAWYVKDFNSYARLFENATEKAVGEASADTLYYYKGSIPIIKKYLGDPKILIILRNPVKRAFSAYQHLVRDDRENLSFEEGLAAEPERILNNWELIYYYVAVSKYYAPVKAFQESFPQVKIIFNEDLSGETNKTLSSVFTFLEVDENFIVDNSIQYNRSGKPKSKLLQYFLWEENQVKKMIRPMIRLVFPNKKTRERITHKLLTRNMHDLILHPDTKRMLINEFEEDIHNLEKLLNKDLSHWLS